MSNNEEWYLETPFGKVAMISWGERHLPPVLMVHGFADSAATFIPLIQHLPNTHYYVSFDFPGHGKSDPVSSGPPISQTFMVEIVRRIVDHMQWETFVFLAHSLGTSTGLFYNHVFPGKMKKMINLEPYYVLLRCYFYAQPTRMEKFFCSYYDNYEEKNKPPMLFTYDQAVQMVMKRRSLTYQLAELVLSRSLVEVEPGLYRINVQPMMVRAINIPISEDVLDYVVSSNKISKLNIHGTESMEMMKTVKFESKTMLGFLCGLTNDDVTCVYVPGSHDVHVTNPEIIMPYIRKFLAEDKEAILSKL